MSGAALALALAALIAPTASGHRLVALRLVAPAPRRVPLLPCAVLFAMALVVVLPMTVVVAAGIVGATLAVRHGRHVRQRQRATESEALQGALDALVSELRVGAHPVAAFESAANDADAAVATSLRAVAARARLGADVVGGLHSVALRSSTPAYWERLAVCWQLAQTHGLGIAALMHSAQRDIVARERFAAGVHSGMAGARATAAVLTGLPVLGVCLGQLIGADPLNFLLSGGVGGWMLIVGVTLACCGLLWADRITGRTLR
ncbi:type II secretion system F family protein [Mycobacterium sp. MMS18-G62]